MFEHIFSEGKIGSLTLKNRLIVPAMGSTLPTADGYVTPHYISYVRARAKGGYGLFITEYTGISPKGIANPFELAIYDDDYIAGLTELTEAVHEEGGKIFCQLHHAGRQTHEDTTDEPIEASSPIPCPRERELVRELTNEEVWELIELFSDGAVRAKKAGFDGVEIHGGHGYLVANFMSGYSNKRMDEFGGSIAARAKFPCEIIKAIKRKCGADFPVSIRISVDEKVYGGRGLPETRATVQLLEAAGVDAINCNLGTYAVFPYFEPPYNTDLAWTWDLAKAVKECVSIPVITAGRYNDPFMVETALKAGIADFVATGRQSIADPEFPNKIKEGKLEDISPCVGCVTRCQMHRHTIGTSDNGVSCMMNPFSGHEDCLWVGKEDEPGTVVVVGAGPAGMEAAWISAARGNKVIVFEKEDRFGGQVRVATMPPYKQELGRGMKWLKHQCDKYGVEFKFNTEAAAADVLALKPKKVFLCTGAKPIVPKFDNDGVEAVLAQDILLGRVLAGKKCVVIGGGLVGLETAEYLLSQNREVSVIEMGGKVGGDQHEGALFFCLQNLKEGNVDIHTNTKVEKLTKDGAICTTSEGEKVFAGYDMVVYAVGTKAYNPLQSELEGKVPELHVIGDAKEARRILYAIHEAAMASATYKARQY